MGNQADDTHDGTPHLVKSMESTKCGGHLWVDTLSPVVVGEGGLHGTDDHKNLLEAELSNSVHGGFSGKTDIAAAGNITRKVTSVRPNLYFMRNHKVVNLTNLRQLCSG